MESRALFQDLVISRRRGAARSRRPVWIVAAAAAHAAGAMIAVILPLLILESVPAPQAIVQDFIVPPYTPPGSRLPRPHRGAPAGTATATDMAPAAPLSKSAARSRPSTIHPPDEDEIPAALPHPGTTGTAQAGGGIGPGGSGEDGARGCDGCGPGGTGSDTGSGEWAPFGDGVLDPSTPNLTQPSLIPGSRALPHYPDLARRARITGLVVLTVVIQADGSVGAIEVVRSPDPRWGFDLEAIEAVKQWRYRPALLGGTPVSVYAQVMIEFTLNM